MPATSRLRQYRLLHPPRRFRDRQGRVSPQRRRLLSARIVDQPGDRRSDGNRHDPDLQRARPGEADHPDRLQGEPAEGPRDDERQPPLRSSGVGGYEHGGRLLPPVAATGFVRNDARTGSSRRASRRLSDRLRLVRPADQRRDALGEGPDGRPVGGPAHAGRLEPLLSGEQQPRGSPQPRHGATSAGPRVQRQRHPDGSRSGNRQHRP